MVFRTVENLYQTDAVGGRFPMSDELDVRRHSTANDDYEDELEDADEDELLSYSDSELDDDDEDANEEDELIRQAWGYGDSAPRRGR
jgi:deferrochelatase/peroxidase EfeB